MQRCLYNLLLLFSEVSLIIYYYSNDYDEVLCHLCHHDLATALQAINEIVEQGEGVQPGDPHGYARHELAHFFKFQEIVCGTWGDRISRC